MSFSFDLISDLHVETWPEFDWAGQPTSPYCVVAGDVSRDPEIIRQTLTHLGEVYQSVFYIDGNDEHRWRLDDLGGSYRDLSTMVESIPNVVYMQSNMVIINGVALLGTNAWWTYDFDNAIDPEQAKAWYIDWVKCHPNDAETVYHAGINDASYMIRGIESLQTHRDVKAVVLITHTVPTPAIINHDIDIVGTMRFNSMGNRFMNEVFSRDTENKIHTWVFGHYHQPVDRIINDVRYINNPRGRGGTPWSQSVYYPKRVEIKF